MVCSLLLRFVHNPSIKQQFGSRVVSAFRLFCWSRRIAEDQSLLERSEIRGIEPGLGRIGLLLGGEKHTAH